MKILHISTSDLAHGAAISAYNLHLALKDLGHDSKILVSVKESNDASVFPLKSKPTHWLEKVLYKLNIYTDRFFNQITIQNILSSLPINLAQNPLVQEADVIHIHNLHWQENHFSILTLNHVCNIKPVVWTFHDMWPITGHCIQSLDCERWKTGCGKCPDLQMSMAIKIDTTAILYQIKKKIYASVPFTVVTPSEWLKDLVTQSPLMLGHTVNCISNGFDPTLYRAIPKDQARQVLGINSDNPKKIILFCVAYWDATFKGYSTFEKSLLQIKSTYSNLFLLGFGHGNFSDLIQEHFSTLTFGYVKAEKLKAILYSAADLMVFPSLGEAFGNVVMESMACGTPVIAYRTGGIPDMIEHLKTGYIARHKDIDDLTQGIKILLENDELRSEMSKQCVKVVSENFTSEIQASRYLQVYQQEIESRRSTEY